MGPIEQNVAELLLKQAEQQPAALAYSFWLADDGPTLDVSYAELDREARQVGAALQARARSSAARVLILAPPGPAFALAFWGTQYAGLCAVPTFPPSASTSSRSTHRLQQIAADAQSDIVLTTSDLAPLVRKLLPGTEPVLVDELPPAVAEYRWLPADSDSPAVLQYTSGSTGTPRGVMLSHRNLFSNLHDIYVRFRYSKDSIGVIWLPPYHDLGLIGGMLEPVFAGFPVTLMPPNAFLQKPARWLRMISQRRATTSGGPNFAYEICATKIAAEQTADIDLSCWTNAFTGAEPVNPATLDRFAERFASRGFSRRAFFPCYGLAEATLLVASGAGDTPARVGRFSKSALEQQKGRPAADRETMVEIVSNGCSTGGTRIEIIDQATLRRKKAGEVGEVWISGPGVALGYRNKPQETAATFGAYIADTGEGPFLRTGDLGFLRDGELFITGRTKDLIIIAGRNLYPQDLEYTVAASHAALAGSAGAAFSVDLHGKDYLVIAHELVRQALHSELSGVISLIRTAITREHGVSADGVLLVRPGAIPKTTSGKIQRHACRNAFLRDSLNVILRHHSHALSRALGLPEENVRTAAAG